MVEFCPYELFLNTKSDIGPCPHRYHEESLREKYRTPEGDKYRRGWERDFFDFVEKLVSDLERKLRRGKDRLDRPSELQSTGNAAIDELEERRTLLDLQIKEKLVLIEQYGEQGEISKAQELSDQVDALRVEVELIMKQESENPNFRLEKRMEVCQTCGAFLIVGDALKRIESHFEGRQHTGWARVRQAIADYTAKGHGGRYGGGGGRRDEHYLDSRRHDSRNEPRHDTYRDRNREPRRDYNAAAPRYDRDQREQGEISDRRDAGRREYRRDDHRRERSPYSSHRH